MAYVDYDRAIGGSTTLKIRNHDNNWVELWIKTGSSTWNNEQTYSYRLNGVNSPVREFQLKTGGAWQMITNFPVDYSQEIRFTIYNTGLGFPTYDFLQWISRATVPPAPQPVGFGNPTHNSVDTIFLGNGDGGEPILEWQLGYSSSSSGPSVYKSGNVHTITGLSAGVTYYFWARGRNAVGWGPWSARTSVKMDTTPPAPDLPVISSITNNSAIVTFSGNGDGGSSIIEWQIGYGFDSVYPDYFVTSDGSTLVSNLASDRVIYFWARGRNAAGWGSWSPRAVATTHDVPEVPSVVSVSSLTQTSAYVKFTPNDSNGSAALQHQVGYGTSSTTAQMWVDAPGTITGLEPGTRYYFWARSRNKYGWSPYSASVNFRTIAGAWVKVGTSWKEAVPYVKVNGVWKVARAWSKIAGVWKETQ